LLLHSPMGMLVYLSLGSHLSNLLDLEHESGCKSNMKLVEDHISSDTQKQIGRQHSSS